MQRFSAASASSRRSGPNRSSRASALLLVGLGLVLILISLFADTLDLGGGEGFGYQQLIGVIVGLALILGAVALVTRATPAPSTEDPFEEEL
jgi:hypothetical protein